MRREIRVTLALLCATIALTPYGSVAGQSPAVIGPTEPYRAVSKALTTFIEREMRDKGVPALSIALVDSQRIVWSRGFGIEHGVSKQPATAQTVYRVGSVSKLFTDIGVMQLVERGLLELDAPVQRFLPAFAPANPFGSSVSLRQLMSHRAGVVREPPVGHYFDDTGPSLSATVASLNHTSLVYAPGSTVKYSNAGIAVVGAVLEQLSGEPFAVYLQRAVLVPMGMTASSFVPTSAQLARVPEAEMWTQHGRTFPAPSFALGMAPAGSMYSTMPDLARFMSALFAGGVGTRGRVLRATSLQEMWRPQFAAPGATTGYGIGFALGMLDSVQVVEHGGAIYGFATQLSAMPAQQLGVAVSAAKDGVNALTTQIAREALRLMRVARLGGAITVPPSYTPIPRALASAFAGSYGPPDSAVTVVVHDSTVTMQASFLDAQLGLRHLRGDTLIVDDGVHFGRRVSLQAGALVLDGRRFERHTVSTALPPDAPAPWRGLIGEYGWDHNTMYILERNGRLCVLIEWFFEYPLTEVSPDVYAFPQRGLYAGERIEFERDGAGRASVARTAGIRFARRTWVGEDGGIFRLTPLRPVSELRSAALAATPPAEVGAFRASELTELVALDSTIRLDIRYASDRNFLSTPMYTQARAFLQRPAAEALVRVHRALAAQGYGLLIHDGYRPWYVTRMFWDGTPVAQHEFVADPASGSKHNRGAAVDLTMYELRTGTPMSTTGGYDEMSDRSYVEYPGGTSRQRALRDTLRAAMEAEGFIANPSEWWHFDYRDWRQYRIDNQRFEQLTP